jgi:ferric-dicitrate binding protein FerR (iron transport regulator)
MRRANEAVPNPPKLVELAHPYAVVIAQGNREYETPPAETERFCRSRARRRRVLRFRGLLLAAALASFVIAVLTAGTAMRPVGGSKTAPNPQAVADDFAGRLPPRTPSAPVVSESSGVTLSVGERKLSDGSVVNLSPGGAARLRDRGKATSVVLDGGKLTLAVEPRDKDAGLEVVAGTYRFKVIGTRFSVTRSGEEVELRVDEGRVAVYGARGELATVSAGGAWSSARRGHIQAAQEPSSASSRSSRPPEEGSMPSPPSSAASPDCRALARRGEAKRAEACYLERSKGTGLDAETALLEVSRLRRDVLGELPSALSALETYRRRFPNGSLRSEADLAHVVLLTRLGRHEEALAESQRLLDSPTGRERAFELRVLRGNIHRRSLGNAALAAQEYAQAEKLDGSNSEASYLLGSSLEALGDARGAANAYRRCLDKAPRGKRASEVRERLERLPP